MQQRVLFIVVCYYNERDISLFVRHTLGEQHNQDFHCMIVDNGSKHTEILNSLTADGKITLFRPEANLGYFGGAHAGLERYKELYPGKPVPFVVLCNTDIQFEGRDFLNKLEERCLQGGFDVLGLDVVSALNRNHQNPYLPDRLPRERMQFYLWITSSVILYNIFLVLYYIRKKLKRSKPYPGGHYYSLHGSFLLFNPDFFNKGGSLHYPSFLFGEEIYLGEISLQKNLKIIYEPTLHVIHNEHSTTHLFKTGKLVKYLHESYQYLLKTFY
jgi:GT2 family glycosyltransferase